MATALEQSVYGGLWQTFTRTFSDGRSETRYQQEIIDGQRRRKRYWLLTTAPETRQRRGWYAG